MADLLEWIRAYASSGTGLAHLVGVALLTAAALSARETRSVRRFVLAGSALWLAGSAMVVVGEKNVAGAFALSLWVLALVVVHGTVLGSLAARRARTGTIVATSLGSFLCITPVALFGLLYISCYVFHDCP